jgi:phosphoribosylanthranilate isomerase
MFRIKVCGITTAADAAHAVACGADAVGINCYGKSPRFASEGCAREIVQAVGGKAEVVAVFVNETPAAIESFCARVGIGTVQLHGDEPQEWASRITLRRIKAIHVSETAAPERYASYPCEAFLLDSGGRAEYGGTGKELPWEALRERFGGLLGSAGGGAGKPWILAGGLTPENVRRAIATTCPSAVDVASGVESAPGRKDPAKVAAFIENAKAGFRIAGA